MAKKGRKTIDGDKFRYWWEHPRKSRQEVARLLDVSESSVTSYAKPGKHGININDFQSMAERVPELLAMVVEEDETEWLLRLPIDLRDDIAAICGSEPPEAYAEQAIRNAVRVKQDELKRIADGANRNLPLRGGEGAGGRRNSHRPRPKPSGRGAIAGSTP